MAIKGIIKTVMPSFVVMAVGVGGAYFVYNNYFSSDVAGTFAGIEPAAGEDNAHGNEGVYGDSPVYTTEDAEQAVEEGAEWIEDSYEDAAEWLDETADDVEDEVSKILDDAEEETHDHGDDE